MRTTPKKLRITSLVSVFGLGVPLLIASACGSDAPAPNPGTTGGTTTGTGGTTTGTGGTTTGTGGTTTGTGGTTTNTGGGISTGGIVGNTGGTVGTGGTTQGGSTQGGSTTTGGTAQGGSTQGGSTTGGTSQGGTSQGGSTGGTTTGGTSQGGSGGKATGGTGTGGTATGGTGTGGTATGGSGGSANLLDVAKTLDGQMLLGPCKDNPAGSVCSTSTTGCPNNSDPVLDGVLTTNKTITLGGDTSKTYTITLHVQGEVEAKRYIGGQDAEKSAQSPKANGFSVGGTPDTGNAYNVYALRVNNPKQDYFLNAVDPPGVSNHTTYGMDYVAKIQAKGGATIQLIAADSNCSMIKNCGPTQNNGSVCAAPIILQGMDPKAVSMNPSFDFTKAYNGQWVVMVVTDVVAN